jgi:hypothetical protein
MLARYAGAFVDVNVTVAAVVGVRNLRAFLYSALGSILFDK